LIPFLRYFFAPWKSSFFYNLLVHFPQGFPIKIKMQIDLFQKFSHFSITMNPAAPEGAPPRRINDEKCRKPPCPAVPMRGPEVGKIITVIFLFLV
jgi:hypothetical protein